MAMQPARPALPWRLLARRLALVLILLALGAAAPSQAQPQGQGPARAAGSEADMAWRALAQGAIVLFRHALAPGTGDPAGFRLGECATQRNLDAAGRAQAGRIGEAFRSRGIAVGQVLTSQWCRSRETAELAFPGQVRDAPVFNSFFDARAEGPRQTKAARPLLAGWQGPGALVVVTHQVNITALTGIFPASGEGVVLRSRDGALEVVGRIRP
jgi:phosphohistidine phosphatase SixA